MIVKWKTESSHWNIKIERIECTRETDKCIWYVARGWDNKPHERNDNKSSQFVMYHDTWEDAKDYLIAETAEQVASARRALESANARHGNAKGLRYPV